MAQGNECIVIDRDSNGRFVAISSGFLFSKDRAPGTFPVEASAKVDKLTEKLVEYLNEQSPAPAVAP
jgi:hypothetical protein